MLIVAAWYQVLARTAIGFAFTPLANAAIEDPDTFTLTRLLQLVLGHWDDCCFSSA